MLLKLSPRLYLTALADLDIEGLHKMGIKGILLDLDNTILPWGAPELSRETGVFLESLLAEGFRLCIVSNNGAERVESLMAPFRIPSVSKAVKPRKKAFQQGLALLGTEPQETAVVGDQIFTDIFGGNRMGLFTILVVPMSKKEFIGTKVVRQVEKVVLKRLKSKGILGQTGVNKD